jgi:hypothetical protein
MGWISATGYSNTERNFGMRWCGGGPPGWPISTPLGQLAGHLWLVALNKQPGVCSIGIGEIYHHLWVEQVLNIIGPPQAMAACGNLNLCAGLSTGTKGAVHAIPEV